ncbi:MAG: amidohydrolase [Oscillospiraceae bacterium]|jgi:5-methylthioadenosine/S-adenosylhomocysteine deaminase|nr:amidohydrolase [Oscillospiraceae bacterium]
MLFEHIAVLAESMEILEDQYVLVQGKRIASMGAAAPNGYAGARYDGRGKLLMSGFFNAHAHTPMTLMRGYGENLDLHSWLHQMIFPFEAQMRGEDAYWGTMLGIAESLRFGIVSTTDMYDFCDEMARAFIETGMKANIGRALTVFDDRDMKELISFQEAEALVRDFHGAGEGRILVDASLHAEYTSTPKVVRQLAEWAKAQGLRMHVHVSETKSEVEGCIARRGMTPPAYLNSLGLFDVPTTAAHCVWLQGDDFALMAEKGVTVASCPASNLKLASGVLNMPALLRAGVPVALGTDSVASNNNLNYIGEMRLFALLHKGIWRDPTLIAPQDALRAATTAGALSQGRADSGRVAVGCAADLIVLDLNAPQMQPVHHLANNLVYSATGSEVCLTMVDGRVLYKDGEYLTLDIEKVQYEASRAAHAVLKRL